ncbi:HU family DNA-binding protein [Bacteroides sp.]|uniref:HU family DNA-binding protein n=1 Tax=Bacteroides sp. TaxID=29523 RepID=UPI003AB67602
MDVIVERFQRRKIVSDKNSPVMFYLRQKPKTCGTVDVDVLAASIQKNCAMTKGDVKHVIEALVEEIQGNLANGDKVKLNQLGTFHMTFRCPGVETSDKCTVRNINKVNIRFSPDKELKLVNGSTAATRSPANVGFVLDKPEDGSGSGNNPGGGSDGDLDENPMG